MKEARTRGAVVEELAERPVISGSGRTVEVTVAGKTREFDVAIDASGRAAIWSRPIRRVGHLIADVFIVPCPNPPVALKLTQFDNGWAYRIGLGNFTTVAILSPPPRRQLSFPDKLARDLRIPTTGISRVGRRVAFVQWATQVVADRVLAVGDAALAHDPVSGQGIRFALASALAASAVIRTWRRSRDDVALASQFYDEFVATERDRHLSFLQSLYGSQFELKEARSRSASFLSEQAASAPQMRLSESLRFSAMVEWAPLHISGFIERGEVIRLSDGGAVRWLGGFDLMRLRELAREAITGTQLVQLLAAEGVGPNRSIAIIQWCCWKRILGSGS
jgi:2-polyprenyl-6-methoxyphenol hydroxylase-like FAD-dependent oxidoreductase